MSRFEVSLFLILAFSNKVQYQAYFALKYQHLFYSSQCLIVSHLPLPPKTSKYTLYTLDTCFLTVHWARNVRCCLLGVWITTEHSHHYYSTTHTQHTDCGRGPCAVWTYKLCECVSGATVYKQIFDEFDLWLFRMEMMNTIYIFSQRNNNID